MEPPADGVLYHAVHNLFRFAGPRGLGLMAWPLFQAERLYVGTLRPVLGMRPSEKFYAYGWVLRLLNGKGGRALDVGCGDSLLFTALLRRYQVYGVDLTFHNLAHHPRLRFIQADIRFAPFASATFDIVIAISTLEHIGDEARTAAAVAELYRLLKGEGRALVTLPLCGRYARHSLMVQHSLFRLFTPLAEEYFIAPAGARRWRPASREEALAIDPDRDLAVVHLMLAKGGQG